MRRFGLSLTLGFLLLCTGCGGAQEQSARAEEDIISAQDAAAEIGNAESMAQDAAEGGGDAALKQGESAEGDTSDAARLSDDAFETGDADTAAQDAVSEMEDHVLFSTQASLADGRTLTLAVVGKRRSEYFYGVSEVRIYDGDMLIQTVFAAEGIVTDEKDSFPEAYIESILPGMSGELTVDEIHTLPEDMKYTECWSAEDTAEVLDLNFDGNADFGLFGWVCNNTIPYYYWTWDEEEEQYRYIGTLQGVKLHPETEEISCEYAWDKAEGLYAADYFRPDENGNLMMDRREIEDWKNILEWEYPALEVWTPQEGEQIPPRPFVDSNDTFVLIRREIPVTEIYEDGSVSYFLEIWERRDGALLLTSREEYFVD